MKLFFFKYVFKSKNYHFPVIIIAMKNNEKKKWETFNVNINKCVILTSWSHNNE